MVLKKRLRSLALQRLLPLLGAIVLWITANIAEPVQFQKPALPQEVLNDAHMRTANDEENTIVRGSGQIRQV